MTSDPQFLNWGLNLYLLNRDWGGCLMNVDKIFTHTFYICLVVFVGMMAYLNSVDGCFIYDDYAFVVNNPHIKHISENFFKFFYVPDIISAHTHLIYRPIRALSYSLDFFIWGGSARGYHFTNIILHLINSVCLYFLYLLIFNFGVPSEKHKMKAAAFFAASLWCLHPVNTETVNWISARSDLLSGFFVYLTLIAYFLYVQSSRKMSGRWYLFSLSFFLLALFSKESSAVLILVIVFYDRLIRSFSVKELIKKWKIYLPYFLSAFAFFGIRSLMVPGFSQRGWWGGSFYANLLTMMKVFLIYVRLLFVPVRLSFLYDIKVVTGFLTIEAVTSVLLWLALLAVFLWMHKVSRVYTFALAWFFIFLLPVSNVVPIRGLIQEHYLYIASFAWALGITYFLFFHLNRFRLSVLAGPAAAVICIVFSYMTVSRNRVWNDDVHLWTDSVKKSPNSFIAHDGLAHAYYQNGNYAAARKELETVIQLRSDYARAYTQLGIIAFLDGDMDGALQYYAKSLSIDAHFAQAYYNMGYVYQTHGDFSRAIALYEKALSISPDITDIYIKLISLYSRLGREPLARRTYERLRKIDPDISVCEP